MQETSSICEHIGINGSRRQSRDHRHRRRTDMAWRTPVKISNYKIAKPNKPEQAGRGGGPILRSSTRLHVVKNRKHSDCSNPVHYRLSMTARNDAAGKSSTLDGRVLAFEVRNDHVRLTFQSVVSVVFLSMTTVMCDLKVSKDFSICFVLTAQPTTASRLRKSLPWFSRKR